jgi:hypothetical protein
MKAVMHSGGSHLRYPINKKTTHFAKNHPRNIPADILELQSAKKIIPSPMP